MYLLLERDASSRLGLLELERLRECGFWSMYRTSSDDRRASIVLGIDFEDERVSSRERCELDLLSGNLLLERNKAIPKVPIPSGSLPGPNQ